jgi:hypothetical protein
VHRADGQALLDVARAVLAVGEAEKVFALAPLDVLEHAGIPEEAARLLEAQEVAVEVFDHSVGVLLGQVIDVRQCSDIRVGKLQELFAPLDLPRCDLHLLHQV